MKLTLPQVYKLSLITLLFVVGLLIAGILFPLIELFFTANQAKNLRDQIKKQWLCWFGKIINLHIELQGCLPERTALIVSNHISWLDIIVIGRCLPAYFVAKSDILSWPIIGYLARQAGTIFIRRGDKQHILGTAERMVWLLKQNSHIIAFPEGTTTTGEEVRGFHASLFQPAMLTKAMVQPVAIEYLGETQALAPFVGDDEFVPHLVKMLSLEKIAVRLSFLPPIGVAGKSRQAVCNESRAAIIEAVVGTAGENPALRSIGE
jgi:lyso-ornithine lipid O-acyltransferase